MEAADGAGLFKAEDWERTDVSGGHGGGGCSALMTKGSTFEQAGVNYSVVEGTLPKEMAFRLVGKMEEIPFFATGVSLVIHPHSPQVPTTHANVRYLEVGDKQWFGGGADLTPYLLYEEDAIHFHSVLKGVCDSYEPTFYSRFKAECDEYFYLPHRGECRGVGGLFFDYLGKGGNDAAQPADARDFFPFARAVGEAFVNAYVPIVERRKSVPFSQAEKEFQLLRRGRYVEFNLLYDRGTLFGLKTGGRTASILMSLPPEVRFTPYEPPPPNDRAAALLDVVRQPRDWLTTDLSTGTSA